MSTKLLENASETKSVMNAYQSSKKVSSTKTLNTTRDSNHFSSQPRIQEHKSEIKMEHPSSQILRRESKMSCNEESINNSQPSPRKILTSVESKVAKQQKRMKMIEEIANRIYQNRTTSPLGKILHDSSSDILRTLNNDSKQSSPRHLISGLNLDKIYNFVNYNLKDKEKISLKDINDIEKKIDNAYARVVFNQNVPYKDRSFNDSKNCESPERTFINKTNQALQEYYRSKSPARANQQQDAKRKDLKDQDDLALGSKQAKEESLRIASTKATTLEPEKLKPETLKQLNKINHAAASPQNSARSRIQEVKGAIDGSGAKSRVALKNEDSIFGASARNSPSPLSRHQTPLPVIEKVTPNRKDSVAKVTPLRKHQSTFRNADHSNKTDRVSSPSRHQQQDQDEERPNDKQQNYDRTTIENLNKIMDLSRTRQILKPTAKRQSLNPIDRRENVEDVPNKLLRTPRLSLGSPRHQSNATLNKHNLSIVDGKANLARSNGLSEERGDSHDPDRRKTMSKMSNTSRGWNLPTLQEMEKQEVNKRKAHFILQAMTTFNHQNGVSPLQGFGSLPKFPIHEKQKTGWMAFGQAGGRQSMKEITDMENLTKSLNEIVTVKGPPHQSPAVERSSNFQASEQKKILNESQSEYTTFHESHPVFRTQDRHSRMNAADSQNSFLNTMSTNRKKQHQRQRTLWDGVMHQKYLQDLQKEIDASAARKKKTNDAATFNFAQMQAGDTQRKEIERTTLHRDRVQLSKDVHQYKKDCHRQKNLDYLKNKETFHANVKQIGEKQKIELNEKLRRRQELKEMQDKTREFQVQTKLNQMRQRRIHAEISVDQLQKMQQQQYKKVEQNLMDKSHATFHYKYSNDGFYRNEKIYKDRIIEKMSKIDHINRITIQKKEQLPILTLEQQIRDKRLNDLADAHVQQKQEREERRYQSEIRQRKENLLNLKEYQEKQRKEQLIVQLKEKMSNLQDGVEVVETDQNAYELFEKHQSLHWQMTQYKNRNALNEQVQRKLNDEEMARLGDPSDRQYALQSNWATSYPPEAI